MSCDKCGLSFAAESGPHFSPSLGLGPIRAKGPWAEPQAPSSGCAPLGYLAAAFAECPGNIKLQDSSQATTWHCPRPSPGGPWAPRNGVGVGVSITRCRSSRQPGERRRQQCRELPRPHPGNYCVLKAANDCRASPCRRTPLPGLAGTRPCPLAARVLIPPERGSNLLRVDSRVLSQEGSLAFHPNTRGCFSSVKVPEESESRGLRGDRGLNTGRAHVTHNHRGPPANTSAPHAAGPEESRRLPSSVHTGARPPVTLRPPARAPACVGDTEKGWRREGAVQGSLSAVWQQSWGSSSHGVPCGLSGEGTPGQRGFVSRRLLAEGAG